MLIVSIYNLSCGLWKAIAKSVRCPFLHSRREYNEEQKLITGFVRVLENLESPGILFWHFPGRESPGKRPLVWKSVKLSQKI